VRLGRGAATTYPGSLVYSDAILIEGSNMAECHPVAFRWVMQAKLRQPNPATIIHADPRFTRTTAMADMHAPIRAGTDIAFLGGIINHVLNSKRWHDEPFFQEYVKTYTNAATIINPDFKDTEDLGGVFSGLGPFKEGKWGLDGFIGQYNPKTWQYHRTAVGEAGRAAPSAKSGQQGVQSGQPGGAQAPVSGKPPYDDLVKSLLPPPPQTDPTLQNPMCVFQLLKKHFSRYTPEMVEKITGCPQDQFVRVAETLLNNSGPDKTSAICYAVGWTQHTYGPQMIGTAALLQLLLGNMGRPGGGIVALRGHATIQGSTDVPTLYHSIHGYMAAPSILKNHETVVDYLKTETLPTGYWANTPKFFVSYLKSVYGDAATADNDWGYGWHPRITGDHSHMPMMIAMAEGRVKGMFAIGQNPAVGGQNAGFQRKALANLDWLVVKDNFETETASFWYRSPEVQNGELSPEAIKTEVFFFPSAQVGETEGTFTNTQRLIKFHFKAADPPGDARSDSWFTYHLGKRLKQLYAGSKEPRDQGFLNMTWDYDPEPDEVAPWRIKDEPSAQKIIREINGFVTGHPDQHLAGFAALKADGSTTCASWIYSGVFPKPGIENLRAASRNPAPKTATLNGKKLNGAELSWGFAWPANRRALYNRASAKPDGTPWSEAKAWVWWDPKAPDPTTGKPGQWVGLDVPDFALAKPPDAKRKEGGVGLDAQSGTDPFIMKADGKGWLFAPSGLVDGPFPTHYEPIESPAPNLLYPKQQSSPVLKRWDVDGNPRAQPGDPKFPYVLTTYRLTEHHLSGVMSRWLPWLAELQPELFAEISPELAGEKGIANLDHVRVSTPRGDIVAKALVTRRMQPLTVNGKTLHHVGLPWHFGYQGVVTGAVTNNLALMVGDPNVTIHEGKAFVCNLEKA
jgi:formate dehydrogenase major subunit